MQSSINTQVVSAIPLRQKSDLVATYPWQTQVLEEADLAIGSKDVHFQVGAQINSSLLKKIDSMT